MRDIVANRRRLGLRAKLRILNLTLRENGARWFSLFAVYYVASSIAERAFASMARVRVATNAPGVNSRAINREIWNNWDWSNAGEEWTVSASWKDALVRKAIAPYLRPGSDVLEIGPGGGRWTVELLRCSRSLVGVDIAQSCVDACRERFSNFPSARFLTTDGRSLEGIDDRSIDFVWSFDAFVHINATDVSCYLTALARVMRPGAIAVIHHGTEAGIHGGWRSNLTSAAMDQSLAASNLELVDRFASWLDGGVRSDVGLAGDVISVIRSPG